MSYLDFEYQLRTDKKFNWEVWKHIKKMEQMEELSQQNSQYLNAYHDALFGVLKACHFNLTLMTKYFWPRYPKDKPLGYANYPFAWHMFDVKIGGYSVFRGSRQISKTTSFACRQFMLAKLFPAFKSLYITPRYDQLQTYQNKFREMEKANRFYRRDTNLRQNLGYKEFHNGSIVEMAYVLTSAAGIRGKSTDELLIDETQNFDPDLELEVMQTQSASTMPITIYSGTSISTDSMLEHKWNESSQGSWFMYCECGHWNIPLLEYGVLDMIQPNGPSCIKCKRILQVREGKFIHAYPEQFKRGFRGFHIPQLIVPAVVYNPIRWANIYQLKQKIGGSSKFAQEVLGIATEVGERELTRKQLEAICTLGNQLERLHHKARNGGYRWVISGCDWGGSDYIPDLHIKVSTTVHAVIGIDPSGSLDLIHFRRYSGMNYDDIVGDILYNHNILKGYAMASDFGVGAVYNSKIREKVPPERHLIFNYVGPTSDLLSEPKGPHLYNQWSLNRTESISLTYEAVRTRRFRCFDWSMSQEYLQDFLNLFRAPGEKSASGTTSGTTTFIYRAHPTKPNDALMAVNYAHMLAKILIGEPMLADLSMKIRLESSLHSGMTDIYTSELPGAISG